MEWSKTPKITLSEESYWKLQELKVKLRAKTWEELVEKICKELFFVETPKE